MFAKRIGVDRNRLLDCVERTPLPPVVNQRQALDALSDIYNKNLKDSRRRIYLYQKYEETLSEKYGWYDSKWGVKK